MKIPVPQGRLRHLVHAISFPRTAKLNFRSFGKQMNAKQEEMRRMWDQRLDNYTEIRKSWLDTQPK